MRPILSSIAAAALLCGTSALAQDAQTAPGSLPEQPAQGELPPMDPQLDPNGPDTSSPADAEPLGPTTQSMDPAPAETDDGADDAFAEDEATDGMTEPAPDASTSDRTGSDRLEPDPTQPPL